MYRCSYCRVNAYPRHSDWCIGVVTAEVRRIQNIGSDKDHDLGTTVDLVVVTEQPAENRDATQVGHTCLLLLFRASNQPAENDGFGVAHSYSGVECSLLRDRPGALISDLLAAGHITYRLRYLHLDMAALGG